MPRTGFDALVNSKSAARKRDQRDKVRFRRSSGEDRGRRRYIKKRRPPYGPDRLPADGDLRGVMPVILVVPPSEEERARVKAEHFDAVVRTKENGCSLRPRPSRR